MSYNIDQEDPLDTDRSTEGAEESLSLSESLFFAYL